MCGDAKIIKFVFKTFLKNVFQIVFYCVYFPACYETDVYTELLLISDFLVCLLSHTLPVTSVGMEIDLQSPGRLSPDYVCLVV